MSKENIMNFLSFPPLQGNSLEKDTNFLSGNFDFNLLDNYISNEEFNGEINYLFGDNTLLSSTRETVSQSELEIKKLFQKQFDIKTLKTPGRKPQKKLIGKKRHSSLDKDNLLCKIQVHFFNFVVNFANDAIKTLFPKRPKELLFGQIEHRIKRCTKLEYLETLKKSSIKKILIASISNKYSKLSKEKEHNMKILNGLIGKSKWLDQLFDMNYLELFKLYYNGCEPLNYICYGGENIIFSNKTKSFFSLYLKSEPNIKKETKLKKTAEDYFLKQSKTNQTKGLFTTNIESKL